MRKFLLTAASVAAALVVSATSAQAGLFSFLGDCGAPKVASCCQSAPAPAPVASCCQSAPAPVAGCCHAQDRCPLTGLPKLQLPKLSFPRLNLFGSRNCCQPAPTTCCGGAASMAPAAGPVEELTAPPSESAAAPYEEGGAKKVPGPPKEVPPAQDGKDAAPAPEAK